jgi:hypothetical protein
LTGRTVRAKRRNARRHPGTGPTLQAAEPGQTVSNTDDVDVRRKSASDDESDPTLAYIGLVLVLVLLPIAAIAAGLYWLLSRWLRRLEFGIIGAIGVCAIAATARWAPAQYLAWLLAPLPGGRDPSWIPPLLPIVLFALPFTSVLGLLAGSKVARKLPTKMSRKLMKATDPLARDVVLPTVTERARAEVSGPAGGLTIAETSHSLADSRVGHRFVPLGIDRHGQLAGIDENELRMHMLILGSTGSGKTETIKSVASSLMDLGWHGIVLDLKEAGDLEGFFEEYSRTHALPYQSIMLSDPHPKLWFNPLHGMRADSALDALMMTQNYGANASFYEAINRKAAGQLLNLMYDAHEVDSTTYPFPTIGEMGRILANGAGLPAAVKKMVATVITINPARTADDYFALVKPDKSQADAASGLGTRLTNMLDTYAGRTLLRPDASRPVMDITADGLTYIGLDTQGRPEMSQVMAGFVLQRVATWAAERTIETAAGRAPRPRFVIVDEANTVNARRTIKTLLQKARGGWITMILVTQSPTDWQDELGDDWDSMAQNTNVVIVMSQGAPKPALMCADLLGTERFFQEGLEVQDGDVYGGGRLRMEEDHRVTPQQLRQLTIGEAILRVGKPAERVSWMMVKMRDADTRVGGPVGPHPALPMLGAHIAPDAAVQPRLGAPDDDDDGYMPLPHS